MRKKTERTSAISDYAKNHGIPAACAHFNLSYTTVYNMCWAHSIKPKDVRSHSEMKEQRRKIAEYAKDHTVVETAAKFDTNSAHVYRSCREFDIIPLKATREDSIDNAFRTIVLLLEGHNQSEVAKMVGFTRAYVSLIKIKAVKAGLIKEIKLGEENG